MRKTKTATIPVTANLVTVAGANSIQFTMVLPWVTEEVYLQRITVAAVNQLASSSESIPATLLLLGPTPKNWGVFVEPVIAFVIGVSGGSNVIMANSFQSWEGNVQIYPNSGAFICSVGIDTVVAGVQVLISVTFQFEID